MKIAVIGTGYVGLVSGACFADFGHTVTCIDIDAGRIAQLERGEVPFFEPGLSELVQANRAAGRLRFTTDLAEGVPGSSVIFLAVGTPPTATGEADMSQAKAAAEEIARHITDYCVVATKSTVPVGTGAWLRQLVTEHLTNGAKFDVVSNPEFLREGSAVNDFMRPDRIVIGSSSERASAVMRELYRPLYLIETPIIFTDIETSEMIKYASNAFLAVKISFVNEMANLCDAAGADVHMVAKGMGLDKRIGSKFLHPGPGYGGSCFPKDTQALAALGRKCDVPQRIVESAIEVNEDQRRLAVKKIDRALGGLAGKTVAVLGLAFKPNTSDVREAPALYVCEALVRAGAHVRAFDPVATAEARAALGAIADKIEFLDETDATLEGADAAVILTDWNEFRNLELERTRTLMKTPIIVDTRNVLDGTRVRALGFEYFCTGRERAGAGPAPTLSQRDPSTPTATPVT